MNTTFKVLLTLAWILIGAHYIGGPIAQGIAMVLTGSAILAYLAAHNLTKK